MCTITQFLEADHIRCDTLFHDTESRVDQTQWEQAQRTFDAFAASLRLHFMMEEEVLFPAFEEATGSTQGPTTVMRGEHERLRGILADANDALERRDADTFFAAAETLQIMMGQHNMKEESVLYPMADRALRAGLPALLDEMRAIGAQQITPGVPE